MAPIVESVEIARSPEDVFAYLDDLGRHGEWQASIVSVDVQTEGPTRVGTLAVEHRKVGNRDMKMTYEITDRDPPRSFAFRGLDGPVRPVGKGRVEPTANGSRVTIELDFVGKGLGKVMLPMVRKQAAKQIPQDHAKLKELLESGAA
jgi:uncharacterized membrane protein